MTESPTPLARLLEEWDKEVKEHGIWTSGHSIAQQIVRQVRKQLREAASTPPTSEPRCVNCGYIEAEHSAYRRHEHLMAMPADVTRACNSFRASTPPTDPPTE